MPLIKYRALKIPVDKDIEDETDILHVKRRKRNDFDDV